MMFALIIIAVLLLLVFSSGVSVSGVVDAVPSPLDAGSVFDDNVETSNGEVELSNGAGGIIGVVSGVGAVGEPTISSENGTVEPVPEVPVSVFSGGGGYVSGSLDLRESPNKEILETMQTY